MRRLEAENDVLACHRSTPVEFERAESASFDFRDAAACRRLIAAWQPTHIVHAGAITLTGDCERDPKGAREANVGGTRNLIEAAIGVRHPPHLTFVSTDLVFDGTKPGGYYNERDQPNPLMEYGRTKVDAENLVAGAAGSRGAEAVVIRSALIFGPDLAPRPCFLKWMLAGIAESKGALFTDEYRSPVFVEDLAALIARVCETRATGKFHAGGSERLSRYAFGLLAAEVYGLPAANVIGRPSGSVTLSCPRPRDVSMDIRAAQRDLDYAPLPAPEALRRTHELEIAARVTGPRPPASM